MKGWLKTTLGNHVDIITGYPFKSELYTESEESIRLLRGDNIIPGSTRWDGVKYWSLNKVEGLNKYYLNPQDLIIAMDRVLVSNGLKIAIIREEDVPALLVQRVARLRANKGLNQKFLPYLVMSHRFEQYVKSVQTETAIPHISTQQINDFPIVLPPLLEQCRIAEILGVWDESIDLLERLIGRTRSRKQGLMQQLLTGKKRFKEFEGSEYSIVKLSEVAKIRRGASPRPIQDPKWFAEKGRGWVRIRDVTASNTYLMETSQYLSDLAVEKSVPVDPGDLIMSICATIGVPRIVGIPACIHDGFVVFRGFEKQIDKFFLYHYINLISAKISDSGQPGTQKNINTTIVGNIEVPKFSISEQEKIADVLSAADEEISTLEKQLAAYKQQKLGLMQQLLTGRIRI